MQPTPTDKTLSAAEEEKRKTQAEKSEDIAYTLNHAALCTLTDFIDPVVANYTQKYLNRAINTGCGHDHSAESGHSGNGWKWMAGEIIGDVAAVPATIAVQRLFPSGMHIVRQGMEFALGPLFHDGARHAAKRWALKEGLSARSDEARAKAAELYENEVSHLPQALMWTVSAIAINLASQKWMLGNRDSWKNLLIAKGAGSSITSGLLVGMRGTSPDLAEAFDEFNTSNVIDEISFDAQRLMGADASALREQFVKKPETMPTGKGLGSPIPQTSVAEVASHAPLVASEEKTRVGA
jgi:hypothetical protein